MHPSHKDREGQYKRVSEPIYPTPKSPGVIMARLTGPVPKPAEQRIRRHKDLLTPGMEIAYDGIRRGPDLPDGDWCDRTTDWWEAWRMAPQAQLMTDTDWESMLEAALIHNAIWSNPTLLKPSDLTTLTKQLHAILQMYGMSYGDRLKLRIKISDDKASPEDGEANELPSNVISMYRDRLGAQ
jgi:hypothetical protein